MSWKLRHNPIPNGDGKHEFPLQVGDWWYCPWLLGPLWKKEDYLSSKYFALPEPRRAPVCIRLPGGMDWVIDSNASNLTGGWDVSGPEGQWTLSPSINFIGSYHGWLQNGVISDDCEGRKFP